MKKIPIFLITGASGSGKTSILSELYQQCSEFINLDLDALYPLFNWNSQNMNQIRNIWFYVAYQIALNHKITVICGVYTPKHFENFNLKDYFKPYYIGLHCNDEVRRIRLAPRGWSDELIAENQKFNHWLTSNANTDFDPPLPLIDTSNTSCK